MFRPSHNVQAVLLILAIVSLFLFVPLGTFLFFSAMIHLKQGNLVGLVGDTVLFCLAYVFIRITSRLGGGGIGKTDIPKLIGVSVLFGLAYEFIKVISNLADFNASL